MPTITIPAIGTQSETGTIYAGIMRGQDGEPDYHLWLIAAQPDGALNWHAAMKWAEEQHAAPPTRREQALLYAQLPEHFDSDWYWSSTQYAGDDAYAWSQDFSYGTQGYDRKTIKLRVRAVRRSVIQ